jgi:RNA polymerase sigma-70 factor (ECF subfamily)
MVARDAVMPRREDRRLLKEVRAGRREAAEEMVRLQYRPVYRFLLHLTGDVSTAEDLTQETFASAWQGIGGFKGRASLATWLHRIAYGRFIDSRRARRRRASATAHMANERPDPTRNPAPLDQAIAGEDSGRLHAAVRKLREDYRVVIVLHYLQGLSLRETAAAVGEPVGTIKWRANQALKQLRASLAGGTSR